ncbi:MAG: 2OG-Fe dioxygenase family protein [Oceanospirillaceae bacterium]|nr:2OG-Fe dioxygenase family protein [Oceanospirillaceae bacterium]
MQEFISSWDSLVCDENMADGGTYRLRRFGVYSAKRAGGEVTEEAHQPHFQTKKFNTLNGGTLRHFSEIKQHIVNNQVMQAILNFGSLTFGAVAPMNDWHIEVHQFRIIAEAGGGKPTPEGIHQDGVDFALMVMIGRSNVTGGETSIYDLEGNKLSHFSLQEPLEVAIVNDRCVAHGVSPILPDNLEEEGYRDVLVVTFKRL